MFLPTSKWPSVCEWFRKSLLADTTHKHWLYHFTMIQRVPFTILSDFRCHSMEWHTHSYHRIVLATANTTCVWRDSIPDRHKRFVLTTFLISVAFRYVCIFVCMFGMIAWLGMRIFRSNNRFCTTNRSRITLKDCASLITLYQVCLD